MGDLAWVAKLRGSKKFPVFFNTPTFARNYSESLGWCQRFQHFDLLACALGVLSPEGFTSLPVRTCEPLESILPTLRAVRDVWSNFCVQDDGAMMNRNMAVNISAR